ncbi:peptidoglycan DD-metalloendopeptidase family protein [Sulfitobacter sp. SK012]|uniref:peptidoglycan DD-metalloendopeptidase family protein n=1 Tax=Sulfitobacter sp. SK012 TaxID=1389005 RepID=UPI0020C7EA86|nr:peptidoglycan DD-metalloendopeptidase family protein [Sulfitobacter sp. SK012]
MTFQTARARARLSLFAGASCVLLTACGQPLDVDLRGISGGFSTAEAAVAPVGERPEPDNRGVISYPNYQVAVARKGDTLTDVARRVGADPTKVALYNGIAPDVELRKDEIIALPDRVAEPSAATGAPGNVDINSVAGGAINRAPATPGVQTAALAPATKTPVAPEAKEPVRHKVERGESAYTIARLYGVPVKSLAEWNGLGADFAIREGQFLLIPVAQQSPPASTATNTATAQPLPGAGSPTPTPPSAAKPLPKDETAKPLVKSTAPAKPVADVGKVSKPVASAKLVIPVTGTIIREYSKGKNEGINIKASPGSPVKAADTGTVAAITKSADNVPIVVLRHADNLLTVYANVTDVSVKKGDNVARGQSIAKLRSGSDAFVHFEVRNGFDSVDPGPYLK